jgi:16S rRNA (adenine1518-N6/adenine1519-N6)-dimethyltransferase
MIEHAKVDTSDNVLEIGSGLGSLTHLLSKRAHKVIAVEVDPRLTRLLIGRFKDKDNVEVIEKNILDISLPKYDKIVSNPPYSISSKLLVKILKKPEKLTVMTVQREFADKLMAVPGRKEYGWLSVAVKLVSDVEILETVSEKAFFPQPKVESVVLRIKTVKPKYKLSDQELFQELIKHLFKNRNKKLKNALNDFLVFKTGIQKKHVKVFIEELTNTEKRPRNMNLEELIVLANQLYRIFIRSKKLTHND